MKKLIFIIFLALLFFSCDNHSSDFTSCLVKGSKINTPNGIEKIENLKVGDTVLSFENNLFTTNEIVKIIKSKNKKKVFEIIFENSNNDFISGNKKLLQTESISATEDHLFFIANENSYKKVLDLKVGDILLNDENQKIKIIKKKEINYTDMVYDISLKNKPHNYFANGILVHNKSLDVPYFRYGILSILNKTDKIKNISLKKEESEKIKTLIELYSNNSSVQITKLEKTLEAKASNVLFYNKYRDENSNDSQEFYLQSKKNNDFSSLDVIKLPIKFYDVDNNFVFQITNQISKICNPQFDDNEKLIKGTITIDQSFIDNPFNGSKKED